jgi:hypothetical protein
MSRVCKNWLVGTFLAGLLGWLGLFLATKPRIMILHSFAEDSSWVRQVDAGVVEALQRNRRPVQVQRHYLDSPWATKAQEVAVDGARRAIENFDPDVLIAVDDEANELIARHWVGAARPRIVYLSINQPPSAYGYEGATNVSGVAERLAFGAILQAAEFVGQGRPLSFSIVGVDNATGRAEMAQAESFGWSPQQAAPQRALVRTMQDWQSFVGSVQTDILIVLSITSLPRSVQESGLVLPQEIIAWTEANSPALPVGTQVGYVELGGGLSFAPPPRTEGAQAIELSLEWLDERNGAAAPPPVSSDHYDVAVRPWQLERRGLALPPIYLEAARANGTLYR